MRLSSPHFFFCRCAHGSCRLKAMCSPRVPSGPSSMVASLCSLSPCCSFPAARSPSARELCSACTTGLSSWSCGANLGAFCSFLLARSIPARKGREAGRRQSEVSVLRPGHRQAGLQDGFAHPIEPGFSVRLLNYFLGLTAVRTGAYALANFLGMLPANVPIRVHRRGGARCLRRPSGRLPQVFIRQILKYVGLLATFAVVIVVTRIARKALREAERNRKAASRGAAT